MPVLDSAPMAIHLADSLLARGAGHCRPHWQVARIEDFNRRLERAGARRNEH